MTFPPSPKSAFLDKAIVACLDNGRRLLSETYDLEFRQVVATRYYLIMVAQEEFAKAFLLYLVRQGIAPWSPALRRAMNDHACKQLTGMILDYVIMHWTTDAELKAAIDQDFALGLRLPNDVGSALEILCYEKISRWTKNNWVWVDDPAYDKTALAIAEGRKDKRKQDALYVRIGSDGQVCATPAIISEQDIAEERERAERYANCVSSLQNPGGSPRWYDDTRIDKVLGAFRLLFKSPKQQSREDASQSSDAFSAVTDQAGT